MFNFKFVSTSFKHHLLYFLLGRLLFLWYPENPWNRGCHCSRSWFSNLLLQFWWNFPRRQQEAGCYFQSEGTSNQLLHHKPIARPFRPTDLKYPCSEQEYTLEEERGINRVFMNVLKARASFQSWCGWFKSRVN